MSLKTNMVNTFERASRAQMLGLNLKALLVLDLIDLGWGWVDEVQFFVM